MSSFDKNYMSFNKQTVITNTILSNNSNYFTELNYNYGYNNVSNMNYMSNILCNYNKKYYN